jgi:pimeloyl-ACP methyl ester carboxylesterase
VRRALGLAQINIVTGSYGSTLTLTAMRHYPESIRSAAIAAPAPPEIDLIGGFAPNLYRTLEDYFARCADDPACGGQYPTVREDFYALAERLNGPAGRSEPDRAGFRFAP